MATQQQRDSGTAPAIQDDAAAQPARAAAEPAARRPLQLDAAAAADPACLPAEAATLAGPEAELWEWLTPLMLRLGLPVLHAAFAGSAAAACFPPAASPQDPVEDAVLHKLRLCSEADLLQVCFWLTTGGMASNVQLLCGTQRTSLFCFVGCQCPAICAAMNGL